MSNNSIIDCIRTIVKDIRKIQNKAFAKLVNYSGDANKPIDLEANITPKCDICGISYTIKTKDAKNAGFNTGVIMGVDRTTVDFYTIMCNGCINRTEEINKRVDELRKTGERKINYGLSKM